ncbi:MAG: hypothetical protein ACRDKI_03885 [Solirubrobacterales bacterium]
MNAKYNRNLLSMIALATLVVVLAGCGSSRTTASSSPASASANSGAPLPAPSEGGFDVLLVDNSNPDLIVARQDDIKTVVADTARRHRTLVIAAIDAGPLRTASWHTVPFGRYYAEAKPKRTAQQKVNALAAGLVPQVVKLGQAKQTADGSGQIGGIQAAGELGNLGRIFVVTDGIPNATGVPDVHSANQGEIKTASKRLGAQISGLTDVPVVFIGVGYGVSSDATVAKAKALMMGTVKAAGASPTWRPALVG